jgi:hypothetical protein
MKLLRKSHFATEVPALGIGAGLLFNGTQESASGERRKNRDMKGETVDARTQVRT